MILKNLSECIGNTPLLKIEGDEIPKAVNLYAKCEGQNPTGSLKDRVALKMVTSAEADGRLKKGDRLLEPTSGNTGISLAFLAASRGYGLTVVMPEDVTAERVEIMKAFGVEIIYSPAEKGTNGSVEKAGEVSAAHPEWVMLDQYSNPDNPLAHYEGTAVEILNDVPDIDYFIAGLGTGGTLMGVGRRIRETCPNAKIIAVQPYPQSGLAGLRNTLEGFIPPILDMTKIDASEFIQDKEAFDAVRMITRKYGIFGGLSSGAAIARSIQYAKKTGKGTIVTVLPDGGWKYLSLHLWSGDLEQLVQQPHGPLW